MRLYFVKSVILIFRSLTQVENRRTSTVMFPKLRRLKYQMRHTKREQVEPDILKECPSIRFLPLCSLLADASAAFSRVVWHS